MPDPAGSPLKYRLASALIHQPRLLRSVAALVRRSGASGPLRLVSSAQGVREVLAREASFDHSHYPSVMLDGPFVIGMPSGPIHEHARRCLHGLLPPPATMGSATADALPALLLRVEQRIRQHGSFDLIEHYLMPLVWNGLGLAYGQPATAELSDVPGLLEALRWLGAQLIIGSVAPLHERARAERAAILAERAYRGADPLLDPAWPSSLPDPEDRRRMAVGLAWVGHPATTQGGALIAWELLARDGLHDELRAAANGKGFNDPAWRETLYDHVLELMRFRPPFPVLRRTVPREAMFPVATGTVSTVEPDSLLVNVLGAMFDPAAHADDPQTYLAGRHFHEEADRWLMFSAGPRRCIARDHVVELLVTALAGVLALSAKGRLRYANRWWKRRTFDGPVITAMPLRR